MKRNDQVSEDDITAFLGNLQGFSGRNREVLGERLAQPLPGHVIEIRVDQLDPDPRQPRKHFSEVTLRELADSIQDQGVLQPLVVRAGGERRYLIVAGERRFRAARLAGRETVPCIVHNYSDEEALIVALVENVHRDDLTEMEKSDALFGLRELTGRTWEQLADAVRLSVPRVKQLAQMQRLAEPVKDQVRARVLSGFKARALLTLPPSEQVTLAEQAAVNAWPNEVFQQKVQECQARTGAERRPSRRSASSPQSGESKRGASATTVAPAEQNNSPRYPPETEDSARDVPGIVVKCRTAVDDALRLLRSTGPGIVNAPYAGALLERLDELRGILLERFEDQSA